MGRSCCVPNCSSNYGKGEHVNSFQFPKDPARRRKWILYISREESFKVTENTVVCIKHFHEQFLVLSEEIKTKDGVINVPRIRPKLADDAYPSIFPSQPSYRTSVPAKRRKEPEKRQEEIAQLQRKQQEEKDLIQNFQTFKEELKKKNTQSLFLKCLEDCVTLTKLEDSNFASTPSCTTIKISATFDVKIFKDNDELQVKKLKTFLGNHLKCERWSKFEKLITCVENSDVDDRKQSDKVLCLAEKLNNLTDLDEEIQDPEADQDNKVVKINFLVEQLKLAVSHVIRYSPDMLVWAAFLCYTYPGAYKALRDTNHLTLPHPKYLQKFLCKIGNDAPGIGPTQIAFMKEKFKLLTDKDKVVTMMLDEIYVNSKISYKGGKVYGIAEHKQNTTDLTAGTMQAFMHRSMRSKNKDVIALFPVRNLDAEMLHKMTLSALEHMYEVGFTVLCLIADNNSVNTKMYEMLCGGELKTCIPNPFDATKPLFLLFDKVHLFKNNRNNWINADGQILRIPFLPQLFDMSLYNSSIMDFERDYNLSNNNDAGTSKTQTECLEIVPQEFIEAEFLNMSLDDDLNDIFEASTSTKPAECRDIATVNSTQAEFLEPSVHDETSTIKFVEARFSDLKDLFRAEMRSVVKLAPKLSRKAMFPSSVERQNVSLVTPVFHDTTIVGLQTLKNDNSADISSGTILYLQIWSRWWKICNVKNPFKGRRLKDKWCEPVMNSEDEKIKFLEDLVFFLEVWGQSEESGKFTDQTYAAFLHTIKTTIELCHYVFNTYDWAYILIGMLQTDNLEGRFGGYRRLSGCNFHISVEQILESERKLKLLGVLSLNSAKSGQFSLSSFVTECKETAVKLGEVEDDIEFFKSAIFEIDRISLGLNERRVLVCLASYAATKTIQQFQREDKEICSSCESNLITDIPLEIERCDNIFDYLSGLDRGGLNRPADFTYDLCVNVFRLFQLLISPEYEEPFLKLNHQRQVIIKLGLLMYEEILEDMYSSCDTCSLQLRKVLKKCLGIFANIFLNNYTKSLNEANTARLLAVKLEKKAKRQATATAKANKEKNSTVVRKLLKLSSKGSGSS